MQVDGVCIQVDGVFTRTMVYIHKLMVGVEAVIGRLWHIYIYIYMCVCGCVICACISVMYKL